MRSEKYLAWVRTQPCFKCGHPESEPHHIIGIGMGHMAGKASDLHTMPLCRECHDHVHKLPDSIEQLRMMIYTQECAIAEGVLEVK